MLCWHRQNLALPLMGNRIPLPLILKLCVPVVTRAFTLSRLRLVLPALNPFTPTRWTNQQFRNIAFSPCPYVCVYIYMFQKFQSRCWCLKWNRRTNTRRHRPRWNSRKLWRWSIKLFNLRKPAKIPENVHKFIFVKIDS